MDQKRNQSHLVTSTATVYLSDTTVLICSWALYTVLCQVINIFGTITNTVNIVCFVKQGFQDSTNISLLGLSCSDLVSLLTLALTCIFLCPAFAAADLPFEIYDVAYLASGTPHFAFTRVSSCITALITLERCLSISKPLQVKSIVTPERTTAIIVCIFIIFTFSAAPTYAVNTLGEKYSFLKNRTIFGLIYREDREQVEKFTLSVNNFAIPLLMFVIITICTLILALQLHLKTKWRSKNVGQTQAVKVSSRNQKIAKMVLLISTLYIVCFLPNTAIMFAIAFMPDLFLNRKFIKIPLLLGGFTYAMESINCSMNIFIYYNMSTKYRDNFRLLLRKCVR